MRRMCVVLSGLVLAVILAAAPAEAANTCTFVTTGSVMTLQGDCTADSTVLVPDGFTLDGNGYTITAVDPVGGHFLGAVVRNAGASASVVNLVVTTLNLANACDAGDDRLRGIMLDGASGLIAGNTVMNINQGPSGCQEGNAIEARNAPFDGTHPNTLTVVIEHNDVLAYQKTGIAVLGDISATLRHNKIGGSATQANLAANSVQISAGAVALVENNHIAGNSWAGPSAYAATAVLVLSTGPGTVVRHNNIMEGNADVGIYVGADSVLVENNRVFETGIDGLYDIGIGNWGAGNTFYNNKVRGYETPSDGDTVKTKVIPSPQEG